MAATHITARERRILSAVAEALLPAGGSPQAGGGVAVDDAADLLTERVQRPLVWVVRLTAWVFELWTLVTHRRRFTRLPEPTRRTVVAEATAHRNPLRSGQVELFKHVLVNPYLSRVAPEIGYDRQEVLASCRARGPLEERPRLTPRTWPHIPPRLSCDVVVVGSGAGGAPVAARLAEAGLDVVVVEEGGHARREELEAEDVWPRFLRLYRDLGLTGTVGLPPIPVPLGRAVGGTTVVNAGTCYRAPDRVLERWVRDHGLEDARPADLDALFAEVEEVQGVGRPDREVLGCNAEVFERGATAMGAQGHVLERNTRGCRGCGEAVVGCPFEAKQAVHLTWLPRAEAAGATILARTRVDRVVVEDGRARGVHGTVLDPGPLDTEHHPVRIDAGAVVVAAGAFHTPVLLARSGVGDPSGGRGRNLQIHPAIGVAAVMPDDVRAWRGVNQSWATDALFDEHGIMIEATSAVPPLTGGQMPFAGAELKDLLSAARRTATCGFLIEDSTTGRVRRGPAGRPVATYQLSAHDRRRIAVGFAWVAEAFLEAGAERVLVGRRDQRWATSHADVRRIRQEGVPPEVLKLSAYHPVGTHRIGADAAAPSDPWGAVRGTDGLWVADASSLPSCLGVNPQVTIMAFALRTAARVLATW